MKIEDIFSQTLNESVSRSTPRGAGMSRERSMKVHEIFESELLFENFDVLEDRYEEAKFEVTKEVRGHPLNNMEREAIMLAREAGIQGKSLVDVYAKMVRANIPLTAEHVSGVRRKNDAGEWIRYFKSAVGFQKGIPAMDFIEVVSHSLKDLRSRKAAKEKEGDFDVVSRGSGWTLFKVESKEASCKLGSGTQWCISSRGQNYFDEYDQDGENSIYMVHARGQKFAIILNRQGDYLEVQLGDNRFVQVDVAELAIFALEMDRAGVDLAAVDRAIGTNFEELADEGA